MNKNSAEPLYPVFETFNSFQGEGTHAGCSAFFIRLYGCPLRCEWCDSAGTWESSNANNIKKKSADDLASLAAKSHCDFCVITGGEPAIHDLGPLTAALHKKGIRIHIETSGAFEIRGDIDWVTLSPKLQKLPIAKNLSSADEIKLIITKPEDIRMWIEKIGTVPAKSIWLHPEWSKREDSAVLHAIAEYVTEYGAPFRAGWQLHKLYNVA